MNGIGTMKNKTLLTIILAIAVVTGSVVAFLLVQDKSSLFWSSYIFSLIALVMIYVSSIYLAEGNSKYFPVKAVFTTLSIIYLIIDIIIIVLFTKFITISGAGYFSIHFITLAIFVIIGFLQVIGKKSIIFAGEEVQEDVINWRLLYTDIEGLISSSDEETKPLLIGLYEKVRYSDPINNPALVDIDMTIRKGIQDLISAVRQNGNTDTIKEKISEITNFVNDRNTRIRVLK